MFEIFNAFSDRKLYWKETKRRYQLHFIYLITFLCVFKTINVHIFIIFIVYFSIQYTLWQFIIKQNRHPSQQSCDYICCIIPLHSLFFFVHMTVEQILNYSQKIHTKNNHQKSYHTIASPKIKFIHTIFNL